MTEGSRRMLTLFLILAVAAGLRFWRLGQLSFWYDEVVTMRLAQAPRPGPDRSALPDRRHAGAPSSALASGLDPAVRIHRSRGQSLERALRARDGRTGLVGRSARVRPADRALGGLAGGLSPPLVYYSREARMYAWLVMLTCLCWGLLFSGKRASRLPGSLLRMAAYSLALTALLYSHPLGLLMAGTLGLGSLLFLPEFFGTWRLAGGSSGGGGPGGSLDPALLRPSARVPLRTAAPQVLAGDADRVHRRRFHGPPRALGLVGLGLLRRRGCLATRSEWSGQSAWLSGSLCRRLFFTSTPASESRFRTGPLHALRGSGLPDPGGPGAGRAPALTRYVR